MAWYSRRLYRCMSFVFPTARSFRELDEIEHSLAAQYRDYEYAYPRNIMCMAKHQMGRQRCSVRSYAEMVHQRSPYFSWWIGRSWINQQSCPRGTRPTHSHFQRLKTEQRPSGIAIFFGSNRNLLRIRFIAFKVQEKMLEDRFSFSRTLTMVASAAELGGIRIPVNTSA